MKKVFVYFFAILLAIVIGYEYLATPYQLSTLPIAPYKPHQLVFAEKVSYMFLEPKVGDRVIFKPDDSGREDLGLITAISPDGKEYLIMHLSLITALRSSIIAKVWSQ